MATNLKGTPSASHANIYIGTFLISFTSLALEVTITRLLSVITFYHLAFFAVSIAMLGMTVGAVTFGTMVNDCSPVWNPETGTTCCDEFAKSAKNPGQ